MTRMVTLPPVLRTVLIYPVFCAGPRAVGFTLGCICIAKSISSQSALPGDEAVGAQRGALFYEEAGEGESPVLLVHGWCCDHACFSLSSSTSQSEVTS
jgi:hypothetical protein